MADKKMRIDHSLLDGAESLNIEKKGTRIERITGEVSLNGIDYEVNIHYTGPTPRGNYRGMVTTINPSDGQFMESDVLLNQLIAEYGDGTIVGRNELLNHIVEMNMIKTHTGIENEEEKDAIRNSVKKEKEKWLRERLLSRCNINFTVCNINKTHEFKTQIIKCVNKLADRDAEQLQWALRRSLMPTEITPITAAQNYVDEYLKLKYSNSPKSKNMRRKREILESLSCFGDIPMCRINNSELMKAVKKYQWHRDRLYTLRLFWRWCRSRGVYDGADPFEVIEKREKSAQSRDNDAMYADILSPAEKEAAINELKAMQNGAACGIALLMSGYDVVTALSFTWSNLTIVKGRDDYVYIEWVKDIRGPIKTFTRVILPAVAPILIEGYNTARSKNKEEFLLWPVVAQERNMSKHIDKKQFEDAAVLLLKQILTTSRGNTVHASKTMFMHTYINDLYRHCGIGDDEGTIRYLSGMSPHSTTDIYYVSYSGPEALDRQYTILSRLSPPVKIRQKRRPLLNEDGKYVYMITPSYSNLCAHIFSKITLQPGERLEIRSRHGVTGMITVLQNREEAD